MAGEAIFIGYRRDDTADVAGRIYDAMAQRFGRQRVFKDVDDIGPGVDFGEYIKTVLPRCRVALVLIGPHWLESKDEAGARRLDDKHDWVRVEIETALGMPGVLVVPVLVNGARMPRRDEVPESIEPLFRRNAAVIRRDPDFHGDVERLATAIRSSVQTGILDLSKIGGKAGPAAAVTHKPQRRNSLFVIGGIAAALALVATGFGLSRFMTNSSVASVEPASDGAASTAQIDTSGGAVSQDPPDFGWLFADPTELNELVRRGEQLTIVCRSCHTFDFDGANTQGPNLSQAFGSTPGTREGYEYSAAMRAMGGTWDYSTLNDFLRSPTNAVRGTKMSFAGVRNQEDRVAIIAYLRSISPYSVPLPAPLPRDYDAAAPAAAPG